MTAGKRIARVVAGAALAAAGIILKPDNDIAELSIFLAAYLIAGGDVLYRAVRNILRGQVFDEHFLMGVATVGAMVIGEYPEGVAVMLFFQLGEYFQSRAVEKSRKSIAALMDIRPDYANLMRDGEPVRVDPDDVSVGDIIMIRPGERIPLDAAVVDGSSTIDASALTGESIPRSVSRGSEILSGSVNQSGLLTAEVTRAYGESTVSRILDLVENAAGKKAKTENFITKFARFYTPAVILLAAAISVVPALTFSSEGFHAWIYRGLTFLVISCPCALVISVPLGFLGGIGGASRKGILVKGSNYLEALAAADIVVFDKTGTLTKGVFEVREIRAVGMGNEELLDLAAHAEGYSTHPISASLKKAYPGDIDLSRISEVEEIAGHGIRATVDGRVVLAGSMRLMEKHGMVCGGENAGGTAVHVAVDGAYAGYVLIADEVKEDAASAITKLKKSGIRKTVMLTGDSRAVGEQVSKALGMDEAYCELLPGDKVGKLEQLLSRKPSGGKLVFVGDGINDAPVLARADVGVAMGGLGSDAAIEAADVVIMTDEPSKVSLAMRISRRTLRIVKQNIVFSITVKFGVLILTAIGLATMWAGVLADVGVTLLAVLNSMRALRDASRKHRDAI